MEHKPGMLRDGFTTGTCAAAAAKAAAVLLCRQQQEAADPEEMSLLMELMTPAGVMARMEAEVVSKSPDVVCTRVQKDAGDDPDVTDGAWIQAEVRKLSAQQWETERQSGQGYWLKEYPDYLLTGGSGIGIATKPGLSCPVGAYAINPVPRQMIMGAVAEVLGSAEPAVFSTSREGSRIRIRISVPEGESLAAKTFNPKLGIMGGISIIGTTGIVRPMSEEALLDTIKLELHMKALEGRTPVFVVPGNYGEAFLRQLIGFETKEAVICSNFIANTIEYGAQEGISRILLTGHIGKLIKVTGGVRNTHSRYGDRRMELLSAFTAVYDPSLAARVRMANTTDEAVGILDLYRLAELVLNDVAAAVKKQAESWTDGRVLVEVVTFSSACGILGKTSQVVSWLADWKDRKGGVHA